MTVQIIPNEFDIYSSLRQFLVANLPSEVAVVRGQTNRVPEPPGSNFVVMTAIRKERLETNLDTYADVLFQGSIASNGTLTVESVFYGELSLGSVIFGVDVPSNLYITKLGTGTGSVGTYTISGTGTTISSRHLAAGTLKMMQPVEVTVQLDVHGPGSADNAFRISTVFRDEYATTAFASYGTDVQPLYADDPNQIPFVNDQNQVEDRWIVEACMQANQAVVNIPQQFFDQVQVGLIEVDSHYPP